VDLFYELQLGWLRFVAGVRKGGGNEQITIYFSQVYVYPLNVIMYNKDHDYPLVATAECFV